MAVDIAKTPEDVLVGSCERTLRRFIDESEPTDAESIREQFHRCMRRVDELPDARERVALLSHFEGEAQKNLGGCACHRRCSEAAVASGESGEAAKLLSRRLTDTLDSIAAWIARHGPMAGMDEDLEAIGERCWEMIGVRPEEAPDRSYDSY